MKNRFNDFSALKAIRKKLEEKDRPGEPAVSRPLRRSRTSEVKSKEQIEEERAAKKRGLRPGCTVTLMDSNDRGVLRCVHRDCVEIEIDGLVFKAGFSDFVVNDPAEDASLVGSMEKSGKKPEDSGQKKSRPLPDEITIDLHIEKIPSRYDAPEGFELACQLEYFRNTLRKYMKHRGMRINFIHGVGDGILRDALRKKIDEVYALKCTWAPDAAGVTVVTVR